MSKLILISGKAEHGKTLTANIIKNKLEEGGKKVTLLPFASYLKFICKEHFGWNGKKDEAGRKVLQYVGTNVVRERMPDFWVMTVASFVEVFGKDFDVIISDDVRFPNELNYFKYKEIETLSVNVRRTNFENSLTEEQRNHPSETSLEGYDFDIYITSKSGIDNLQYQIENRIFQNTALKHWFE